MTEVQKKLKEIFQQQKAPTDQVVIVAPHPDDELIGCWSILNDPEICPLIIYTCVETEDRKAETVKLRDYCNVKGQLFLTSIPQNLLTKENLFFIPDPIYETHPDHRMYGHIGESLARGGGKVIFYSVNMLAPYIYKVPDWEKKKDVLDHVYPSQSSLWNNDLRYCFFEGFTKWIFPTQTK